MADTDFNRPVYGSPLRKVHGQTLGMIGIEGEAQIRLLMRVLETGMRDFAGRHEETFLAKVHRDLASMSRRAVREKWTGWDHGAPPAALEASHHEQ